MWVTNILQKSSTSANRGDITSKVVFEYYSATRTQSKYETAHGQAEG